MNKRFRHRVVIADRPTVPAIANIGGGIDLDIGDPLPPTWVIYHAARPIHGDVEWRDGGGHGSFYAVVNPDGERAAWMTDHNRRMDATILEYVAEQTAFEKGSERLRREYPDNKHGINRIIDDPESRSWVIDNYVRTHFTPDNT